MARKGNVSFASEIRAAGEHALVPLEDGLADYAKRAAPQTARDNPDETPDEEGRSGVHTPA